jgi:hypothetical protein
LIDAPKGKYWKSFVQYLHEHIQRQGLISDFDFDLFKITDSLEEAKQEILNFYYNFHSYRFVGDICVIRMKRQVPEGAIPRFQEMFADMLTGDHSFDVCAALPEEDNEPELKELPRLCVRFNNKSFGRLRKLIDHINLF